MLINYELKPIKVSLLPVYSNDNVREYRIAFNHPIMFYKKDSNFKNKLTDMIEVRLRNGKIETIIFIDEGLYVGHIEGKININKYEFIGTDIDTIVENVMRIIKKFNLEQSLGE